MKHILSDEPRGPLTGAAWLVLTAILASCGSESDGDDGAPSVSARDSAGIEIVHSSGPAWRAGGSWTVSQRPTLEIGAAAGDEAYTLFGVRAATRLEDGRIAVANQGTDRIRIYDATGGHLRDIGREGDGPGEFQLLMDLWRLPGDSLMAADNRLGRLTVFDAVGELERTVRLVPNDDARQVFGRRPFDDGTLLVSGVVPPAERPREGLFDGGTRRFARYAPDGTHMNPIGAVPHGANWGFDRGGGIAYTTAPFSIFSPPHASDGETVLLGDGTAPEVEQRSAEGELLRIVRWSVEPRPVTSDIQARYRENRMEGASTPEARQHARTMLDGIYFPDSLPVYDGLMVDSEGHLWVEQYQPAWQDGDRWWVFDPSGRWLGAPAIPSGLELLEVGRDYVLGVARDQNDVERVVMHDLNRDS